MLQIVTTWILDTFFLGKFQRQNLQFSSVTGWGVDPTSTGYVWICLVDLFLFWGFPDTMSSSCTRTITNNILVGRSLSNSFFVTQEIKGFFLYHGGLMVIYHGRRLRNRLKQIQSILIEKLRVFRPHPTAIPGNKALLRDSYPKDPCMEYLPILCRQILHAWILPLMVQKSCTTSHKNETL